MNEESDGVQAQDIIDSLGQQLAELGIRYATLYAQYQQLHRFSRTLSKKLAEANEKLDIPE